MHDLRSQPWSSTAETLASNCRAPNVRGIGLEIERIGMWEDGTTLHYRPQGDRPGAEKLLNELGCLLHWKIEKYHEQSPLGLSGPWGKVSLEPGSQLEFSANPCRSVTEAAELVNCFETQVDKITTPWGIRWLGLGINPVSTVEQMDIIPLTRYGIMTDYLGRRGTLGTTMMRLSSSIQINFDYSSETEAIEMLRVGLAVAPIATALFGNSPISRGRANGWLSLRSEVWRHTDPDRTGMIPEAFEDGFGFKEYAQLACNRPLMFAQNSRGENVLAGKSLVDIANGLLPGVEANEENQLNPLRQLFTEARLKPGYVEIRSIDGLRVADRYSAVAFWTGLMYDAGARAYALDTLGGMSSAQRNELWTAAGRYGLRASVGVHSALEAARGLLRASKHALQARGLGEEKWLAPIEKNLHDGKNPAERVLEVYDGVGKHDVAALIRYSADRTL